MRKLLSLLAALGLAGAATAATTFNGIVADADCTIGYDAAGLAAELYGWKIKNGSVGYTDVLADLSHKTGTLTNVGGASITSSPAWSLPPNWRLPEAAEDVVFAVVTANDGRVHVNSGAVGLAGGDPGFAPLHVVGHGIPTAWGVRNAMDLAPSAQAGDLGIHYTFAPVPEVTGGAETFGVGCHVGGLQADPNSGLGIIAGYNVYRVTGTCGAEPTPADVLANATDGNDANGGWVYFVPALAFDWTLGDVGRAGEDAPSDANPQGDLAGLNNADMSAYTGDDAMVLQDSPNNPDGTARCCGRAPSLGGGYWYFAQPVMRSPDGQTIADLEGVSLASSGAWTASTMDVVPGGAADAADLDGDGSIEFFSPQADVGIGGYGLTNGSLPLLSPGTCLDWTALAPGSTVSFQGTRTGSTVALRIEATLETANVLGFNVYRHDGFVRLPVNDLPILASGGEGSLYTLVDDLAQTSRRTRRGGTLTYTVDVLFNDGTPTATAGPFEVAAAAERAGAPQRRGR
jgi:hypothetical protein